jgi:hypothetical protein
MNSNHPRFSPRKRSPSAQKRCVGFACRNYDQPSRIGGSTSQQPPIHPNETQAREDEVERWLEYFEQDAKNRLNRLRVEPEVTTQQFFLNRCVVCQKNVPSVLFTKCGHFCMCNDCFVKGSKHGTAQCPLCRRKSDIIIQVSESRIKCADCKVVKTPMVVYESCEHLCLCVGCFKKRRTTGQTTMFSRCEVPSTLVWRVLTSTLRALPSPSVKRAR